MQLIKLLLFVGVFSFNAFSQNKYTISFPMKSELSKTNVLSGPKGHVIWESGKLDGINPYFINQVHHHLLQKQRDPLIYKQIGVREWTFHYSFHPSINLKSKDITFELISEHSDGRFFYQGDITSGNNEIHLKFIHSITNLRIIAKSDHFESTNLSLEIKELTVTENIPLRVSKKNKDYKPKLKNIKEPIITPRTHCGIPQSLYNTIQWENIKLNIGQISDYCNFVRNLNFIRKAYILPAFNAPPKEPLKPAFMKSPEEAQLENALKEPQRKVISDKELRRLIAEEYNSHSYIDVMNAFETNSAYLIDLSSSAAGKPLDTIKSELNIMLELLEEPHTMSLYRMGYKKGKGYNIFFENFKGKKSQPRKKVEYSDLISSLEHDYGGDRSSDDEVLNGFMYALNNSLVDTINILSDIGFEEFRRDRGDYLIRKIKNQLKKLGRPITINIYNFDDLPLHLDLAAYCEEIVKLGKGDGKFYTDKKLRPGYAVRALKKLRDSYIPEKRDLLLKEYQGESDREYEQAMANWQSQLAEIKLKNEEYEQKYQQYLQELDQWKESHSRWKKQMSEYRSKEKEIYLKMDRVGLEFFEDKSFEGAFKELINNAQSKEEKSFYQNLAEFCSRSE